MVPAAETFRCDRQGMTLTTGGCARLWRSVRTDRPKPWEARANCLGCPIGAQNAGERIEDATKARYEAALRRICPRCIRPASRLINGVFCVSCYNREREIARGRNCKGNRPVVVESRLHAATISIGQPHPSNQPLVVETFQRVTSRVEAILLAAKRASGPVYFGPAMQAGTPA